VSPPLDRAEGKDEEEMPIGEPCIESKSCMGKGGIVDV
jgi:hypothetical protein